MAAPSRVPRRRLYVHLIGLSACAVSPTTSRSGLTDLTGSLVGVVSLDRVGSPPPGRPV
jgi:hypothetical protein